MIKRVCLALALLLAPAIPAHADGAHNHESKHGGMIVDTDGHHLEVVARDGALEVYVMDEEEKPEDVKDAKATASVLSEGKKEDIVLAPKAGNVLEGTGAFKAAPGTTIVITLTMPEHKPIQARVKLD